MKPRRDSKSSSIRRPRVGVLRMKNAHKQQTAGGRIPFSDTCPSSYHIMLLPAGGGDPKWLLVCSPTDTHVLIPASHLKRAISAGYKPVTAGEFFGILDKGVEKLEFARVAFKLAKALVDTPSGNA